ncbi:MAG: OmpA family protein [Ketobacter sp.]|nr:OmpA family protein [Ketobacter sp.]
MKNQKRLLLVLLGSLPFSAYAQSQVEPFSPFIGVKGGYQWTQDDNYNHSEPDGAIYGVYGGLQFSPTWSWDLGYQYHDDLNADATSVNVKTWLIESALRYDWHLQDNLSLYGRVGAAYWDMDKIRPALDNLDATGFSPLGEVGVAYGIHPNLRLSAGYQYIDSIGDSKTGKYDSQAVLVGLSYTFGRTESESEALVEEPPFVDEVTVVETQPQTFTYSSKNINVLFGFDSSEAQASTELTTQLKDIASELNTYPQARAIFVGHTDSTGSEAYNQALSERRAQAVANKVMALGVNAEQIEVQGKGESQPIADNRTAEGQAQNRRVDVTIPSFQYQE